MRIPLQRALKVVAPLLDFLHIWSFSSHKLAHISRGRLKIHTFSLSHFVSLYTALIEMLLVVYPYTKKLDY